MGAAVDVVGVADLTFVHRSEGEARVLRRSEPGEPGCGALFAVATPLGGAGLARDAHSGDGGFGGGAERARDDLAHSLAHFLHDALVDADVVAGAHRVGIDDLAVDALDLLDETALVKRAAVADRGHGLGHLQRRDFHVALPDGKAGEIPIEHFPPVHLLHVFLVGNTSAGLGADGDAGAGAEPEISGPFPHAAGAGLDADLVKPGVARLGQRFAKVQRTGVAALPVAEIDPPDSEGAGALEFIIDVHHALLQGGEAGGHFENRTRRIRRAVGAGNERDVRVLVERLEGFLGNGGDEPVGIDGRPGGHGEDFAIVRVDEDHRAALHTAFERLFAQPLEVGVEGGDDVVTGLRIEGNLLAGFLAAGVEGDVELPILAVQLVVEGLLQALASHGVRPEQFVVLHRPVRHAPRAPRVAEDVPGELALRIVALIDGLEGDALGLEAVEILDLRSFQILRDEHGKDAAILVVLQHLLLREGDGAADDVARDQHLLVGKGEDLGIGHGERRGKADAEILAHAGLGEWVAVAIHDLPARAGDAEDVGASLFLGIPSRCWDGGGSGCAGLRGHGDFWCAGCRADRLDTGDGILRAGESQGQERENEWRQAIHERQAP